MKIHGIEFSKVKETPIEDGGFIYEIFSYKYSSPSKSCTSNAVILWISLIVCAVLVGGTVAAVVTSGHEDGTDPADEIDWDIDASKDYIMRLVKRGQWSVHSDIKVDDQSVKPAKMVIILHTADKFCGNTTMCENRVCSIEAWHIQIGYGTIGYSFLIGGDGRIYEGRGWGKQGAFALGFNCASVGIAFIGNYDNDELTDTMIEAYNILVTEGVRRHAIDESYKMFGHYQVKENGTRSPGANIKKIFKSWPHWTAVVTDDDKLCADSS